MPPAVPIVAAVAASYVASSAVVIGAVGLFGASVAGFAVSTAVNAIGSRALSKSQKGTPGDFTGAAQGRAITINSTVESHKIIYGTAKVSGPVIYQGTTDSGAAANGAIKTGTNKFLHLAIALAGHEVEDIGDVYFNDTLVATNADGWVTSAPYSIVQNTTASVNYLIVTATRQNGFTTVTTNQAHGLAIGQQVLIRGALDRAMDGRFNITSVPATNQFTYASGRGTRTVGTGGGVFATVTTGTTLSYARVKKFKGTESQAASPDMIAGIPGWTANHRLQGVAYLYVRLEYNADAFQGPPNISAIVKGKKLLDPRTGLTAWSTNAALCIRDYLAADYGFNCDADEIDDDYFISAANVSDEQVPLTVGGTQPRYTCNGVIDTGVAPIENLNAMVSATAGAVTYVQGKFRCHAGTYDAPAGDIDTSMLAGPAKVKPRIARQQLFNAVRGTYVDPELNWQPTDFPPITNPLYEGQDGGELIFRDIELAFANGGEKAQRIAKIILEQGRQQIQVELTLNHKAMVYSVWDTITYTDPAFGWDHKVFRIKKLSINGLGPVTLSLQEEASSSYDWNNGMATTVDFAPDTELPDPFTISPPNALTVTEELYITRDGGSVKSSALLTWLPSPDAFVRQYQAEYKLSADADWRLLPRTEDTQAEILDILPGGYDFRVKALNNLGVSSPYATASKSLAGLLAPPTAPQNLTISTIGGLAILRWDQSPDPDVRIGGRIVFRHSPDEAAAWAETTTIGNPAPGAAAFWTLPLKPGVYQVKTVDSSGTESVLAASVVTEQATALAYANVTSLTEDPAFTGVKTNVVEDSGILKLSGAALFSEILLLSAVPSVALSGGIAPTGTYKFSGGIDLGTVRNIRLTSHIVAQMVNQLDTIRSRTALMSTWASFTGANAAEGDAQVWVRVTNDDPSGSPAWKDWQRMDSGEFICRAIDPELRLSTYDPSYNVLVSELSLLVDEVS